MKKRLNLFSILFQEGHREMPRGITYYIFVAFSILISVFVLWLGWNADISPYHYSVIFVTLILPLAFITTRITKKPSPNPSILDYVFALLVMGAGVYLLYHMDHILTRISAVHPLNTLDKIAAGILLLAVLELCRRSLGIGFTSILLIGLAYAYYGHLMTGAFGHRLLSNQRIFDELIFTTNGIFGAPVQVAATYAFLFIMFGFFVKYSGAGQFIIDFCAALVGRRTGGLAKIAVTTSAAFGSISGSPVSDVATTGSINIPNMKKSGYSPVFAGAVETSASSGGTILPPVMGSVAFLMAEFTGISYFEIALASVIGALLYFLGVYWQVHFRSLKLNLTGMNQEDLPKLSKTLLTGFYYVFPIIILIWAMEKGMTPSTAAIYAIVVTFLISFIRRGTWITLKKIIDIFTTVVYQIAPLAVATAAAGIIIGVINLTGLAGKFTSLIFTLTGEMVFLSLVVGAVICIILGMGMPTPSAYILVAALVAPAFIQLGLDTLSSHLFLVFFCALSAITPPVGVAAYTAAGIANASPLSVGIQATKLASVGFIIPFMFMYHPSLLLQGSVLSIILTVITAIFGVYALAAGMEGYLHDTLSIPVRILLIVAAIFLIYPDIILNMIAAGVIAFFYFKGNMKKKSSNKGEFAATGQ